MKVKFWLKNEKAAKQFCQTLSRYKIKCSITAVMSNGEQMVNINSPLVNVAKIEEKYLLIYDLRYPALEFSTKIITGFSIWNR